jgi:hypothetical protein
MTEGSGTGSHTNETVAPVGVEDVEMTGPPSIPDPHATSDMSMKEKTKTFQMGCRKRTLLRFGKAEAAV